MQNTVQLKFNKETVFLYQLGIGEDYQKLGCQYLEVKDLKV